MSRQALLLFATISKIFVTYTNKDSCNTNLFHFYFDAEKKGDISAQVDQNGVAYAVSLRRGYFRIRDFIRISKVTSVMIR